MKIESIQDVNNLSYTDFISLLQEENRPSGGKRTIRSIAQNAFVSSHTRVLEIGCTNGFSSIELHRITGCNIIGIDINQNSVNNANARVKAYGLDEKNIRFIVASADALPFPNDYFDLIICGNALSFISNKDKAVLEMQRCLRPSGFLSLVPIWYNHKPDENICIQVSQILGFEIQCTFKTDWINFADKIGMELYYMQDYTFDEQSEQSIDSYIDKFFTQKPQLLKMNDEIKDCVKQRWKSIITVFYRNLTQTSFSVMLLRKNNVVEEVELFTAHPQI